MRKGVIEAAYTAGFVLICFIAVNAVQIWAVRHIYLDFGGYPLSFYYRYANVDPIDGKAALLNYLIAISVAGHVALGVFALFNAKAIIRWIRRVGKFE